MEKLYNSSNFLVRFVHNQRLNLIKSLISKENNLKILDAGCGEGHLIKKLFEENKNCQYYGIDITPVALKNAKERCPDAEFFKMDLKNIGFSDNFFDIVVCTETIEHIYNYQRAITELVRILGKNGSLIITFPNEFNWKISRLLLGRNPIRVPDHVNSFTPKRMTNIIKLTRKKQINLPFFIPFGFSLGCLMEFKKDSF